MLLDILTILALFVVIFFISFLQVLLSLDVFSAVQFLACVRAVFSPPCLWCDAGGYNWSAVVPRAPGAPPWCPHAGPSPGSKVVLCSCDSEKALQGSIQQHAARQHEACTGWADSGAAGQLLGAGFKCVFAGLPAPCFWRKALPSHSHAFGVMWQAIIMALAGQVSTDLCLPSHRRQGWSMWTVATRMRC